MIPIFVAACVLAIVWCGLALLHGYQDNIDLDWHPLAVVIGGMLVFAGLLLLIPEGTR